MFSNENQTMQRPWNLPSFPVYSLATYEGQNANMNICTYVTAVSMQPKIMAIAVYENTKTLENLRLGSEAVLQLLHPDQWNLVRVLGKKSGLHYDKSSWLKKKQLICEWQGYPVLEGSAAYMQLNQKDVLITGDHHLHLFEVMKFKTLKSDVLTTQMLNDKKIIRI